MKPIPEAPSCDSRSSEAGSAYLVAILALVVLTIAGLALALITQTEMQIGANEKSIERAFYAADTGIALATARTLVTRRPAWSEVYEIQDPEGYGLSLEHRMDVSPFFPIGFSPCNLCDINNAGQYGATNYHRVNHAVASTAIRRVPGTEVPLAERAVGAMVEFQPWQFPPEAILPIQDEGQLEKVQKAF
jgi:Tfp pilus assembly protein PilX